MAVHNTSKKKDAAAQYYRSRAKPTNIPGVITDILQAFRLYVSDKVLDIIVAYTNKEAERVFAEKHSSGIDENENSAKWRLTDKTKILAYIDGLVITADHLKQNHLPQNGLWDKKYGPSIFRAAMPQYRFIALTFTLHAF